MKYETTMDEGRYWQTYRRNKIGYMRGLRGKKRKREGTGGWAA